MIVKMVFGGGGLYGVGVIRAARLSAIEALLQEHHVLSTKQLAENLGVSEVTVRRDLDGLDGAGQIERVFGGARLAGVDQGSPPSAPRLSEAIRGRHPSREGEDVDEPFAEVLSRNAATKRAIARRAATLVRDGETVFLDIGTTTYELARELVGRRLTVVTASLGVVELLGAAPEVELVVLGGDYNKLYRCTQGPSVVEAIAALQIDRVVLGCAGISDRGAVRDTDASQVAIKRAACRTGAALALLADSSKLPGIGAYTALDLADVDHLVTDVVPSALTDHLNSASDHMPSEVLNP